MPTISLNTNVASLDAQRSQRNAEDAQGKTIERLASGLRINSASDDAAGLAIASSLQSKSRVYAQAVRNLNDGTSLLNIAQGAMEQLVAITTRQQELAEQAANGTYSSTQRKAINTEANALVKEFNRIVSSTSFNGQAILTQQNGNVTLQDGYGVAGSLNVNTTLNLSNTWDGTFTASSTISGSTFADINGDGSLDLVQNDGSDIQVALGNGDGTFQAFYTAYTGSVDQTSSITTDLNGDGNQDLIFGTDVFISNGHTLTKAPNSGLSDSPNRISTAVVGDFNGDGKADIAQLNYFGVLTVQFGNGNGTFNAGVTTQTGARGEFPDLHTGDFNGDGKQDLVIGAYNPGSAYVLYGNGNGTFRQQALDAGVGTNAVAGDFNGDGITDFAVTDAFDASVDILLGNANGTFTSASSFSSLGSETTKIDITDLDKDGVLDLVVTNYATASLSVFLGNGDGGFKAGVTLNGLASGAQYESFNTPLQDVNGDGVPDIVDQDSGTVYTAGTKHTSFMPTLNLYTQSSAQAAIPLLSNQLNALTSQLGVIGGYQSTIGFATNNLQDLKINYDDAESKIMDVDVAESAADLTRESILTQAATSVLAQANQEPALALKLLG